MCNMPKKEIIIPKRGEIMQKDGKQPKKNPGKK